MTLALELTQQMGRHSRSRRRALRREAAAAEYRIDLPDALTTIRDDNAEMLKHVIAAEEIAKHAEDAELRSRLAETIRDDDPTAMHKAMRAGRSKSPDED